MGPILINTAHYMQGALTVRHSEILTSLNHHRCLVRHHFRFSPSGVAELKSAEVGGARSQPLVQFLVQCLARELKHATSAFYWPCALGLHGGVRDGDFLPAPLIHCKCECFSLRLLQCWLAAANQSYPILALPIRDHETCILATSRLLTTLHVNYTPKAIKQTFRSFFLITKVW